MRNVRIADIRHGRDARTNLAFLFLVTMHRHFLTIDPSGANASHPQSVYRREGDHTLYRDSVEGGTSTVSHTRSGAVPREGS